MAKNYIRNFMTPSLNLTRMDVRFKYLVGTIRAKAHHGGEGCRRYICTWHVTAIFIN